MDDAKTMLCWPPVQPHGAVPGTRAATASCAGYPGKCPWSPGDRLVVEERAEPPRDHCPRLHRRPEGQDPRGVSPQSMAD